jgi:quinol monooxygenase YgiN
MIHVMASIVVRPEHAAAAKGVLIRLAETSRREAVALPIASSDPTPNVFQTVEQWRAQAASTRT